MSSPKRRKTSESPESKKPAPETISSKLDNTRDIRVITACKEYLKHPHSDTDYLASRFVEWDDDVNTYRQILWGHRYAERHGTLWEGSGERVTEAADKCLANFKESQSLHLSQIYISQYYCRRCKKLNDSKYKPYCTGCTEIWKAEQQKKKKNSIQLAITRHLEKMDALAAKNTTLESKSSSSDSDL